MRIFLILWAALSFGCSTQQPELITYVNTFSGTAPATTANAGKHGIGTEEYAQTLPAVLVPHGMTFWTPQTRGTEQKCVAPYYYTDSHIQGFRASHWIVGGCTQDYGSTTLMMTTGEFQSSSKERTSAFSHTTEVSTPAYYKVVFEDYGITCEMTGTSRAALFRFTFDRDTTAYLIVTPNSDEGLGFVRIDSKSGEIVAENPVHRIYQGGGESAGFSGHSVVTFEKEIEEYGVFTADQTHSGQSFVENKPSIGAYVKFKVRAGEQITVRMGCSFTGENGAKDNMIAEIDHYDFDKTRAETEKVWNETLGVIKVVSKDTTALRKFYTAMYHSLFLPHEINDVDGFRPVFAHGMTTGGVDGQGDYYDDFSAWDTYRALHPLLNITSPDISAKMVNSLIDKYHEGGWLPIFPCWNSYTAAMIGDHCTAIICDAWVKGVRGFDINQAYQAMRKNAFESPKSFEEYKSGMGRRALESYLKYGYIPLEDPVAEAFHKQEQVSRTLEYAYDDYVLGQVANSLGHTSDAKELLGRGENYRNVIDPATGWARGRYADGTFVKEFNPFGFEPFITEGYPCQYSFYAPQNIEGLVESMGGVNRFTEKLDTLFDQNLYWHGNEPSHHIAFLYNYAGQPWKTQREVRRIMVDEYNDSAGGLSGNDDAGQMSAWYVFAAMGFYPVCPGTPYYQISSPSFEKLSITLSNGKTFTIKTIDGSDQNIYIKSATLNGKPYTKSYFSHEDILGGGVFEFTMSPTPTQWAITVSK